MDLVSIHHLMPLPEKKKAATAAALMCCVGCENIFESCLSLRTDQCLGIGIGGATGKGKVCLIF